MIAYGMGLLAVSVLVAQVVPLAPMGVVGGVFGEAPGRAAPALILKLIAPTNFSPTAPSGKISKPDFAENFLGLAAAPQAANS